MFLHRLSKIYILISCSDNFALDFGDFNISDTGDGTVITNVKSTNSRVRVFAWSVSKYDMECGIKRIFEMRSVSVCL